jgi:signal transduction histidine kinase/CheY-like chemotaxis protein
MNFRVRERLANEQSSPATASLEEELLRSLARQARRVPVPVFLAALMIAGLASDRVPTWILAAWLALVVAALATRWIVLGWLVQRTDVPERERLRAAIALSAMNGIVHGLSLGFFAFLPEFERALQSMLFVALCAGSVATTTGYMPVFLAYVLPMIGPLTAMWAFSPGLAGVGWIEFSTAALSALLGVLLFALARDAFRMFSESFAIRLHQAELNRQLQSALEQAEAANRAKTRFLASASHDLRQPIHTLSLFGAALTMRTLDGPSREIAQHMNAALQALASQLDALLDISKLDAGIVRVNQSVIKLRSLLERMCKEFEPAARGKGLEVTVECPQDSFVATDQSLLERVIRNLLDNAVKYTDSGRVSLRVTREAGDLVIAIADSGRGIPEEEQTRVFEEFYQLDNPERDRARGLGLGLAIVRRLTDLLCIRMGMESSPGRGTTFYLALSAVHQAANGADAKAAHAEPAALHVLVVDDEAGIRLGMKTLLEGMGCRATLAGGTLQAVAAARAERPDIVLSDLRLRGDDNGIKAVRAIRDLYPRMPAILISGDIAPDRLREAEEAGIPLLHKPVPVEVLKSAIAKSSRV